MLKGPPRESMGQTVEGQATCNSPGGEALVNLEALQTKVRAYDWQSRVKQRIESDLLHCAKGQDLVLRTRRPLEQRNMADFLLVVGGEAEGIAAMTRKAMAEVWVRQRLHPQPI